jgi:lipopolysaccharide/colanic/teichoic acid biosynthesis glycosyltransferase
MISADTFSAPVVGTINDVERVLIDHPVDEVFVVGGAEELVSLLPVVESFIKRGRLVSVVTAPGTTVQGVSGRVTNFSGVPMISFGPMPKDEMALGLKRIIDVGVSLAGIVVLSPIMAAVAIAIKIFDPGPIFFRQERLGVGGRSFRVYKFRSMRADAEDILRANPIMHRQYVDSGYKLPEREDPRISKLGSLLRKTSLDEIPQLWNVLVGDMTLVGPRPIVPAELENYAPYEDLLLSVRPGITGQWQVKGRSKIGYPERAILDFDYIGGHSILEDFRIMMRTVPAVLMRRGAH